MPLIYSDGGEKAALDDIVAGLVNEEVRLFQNDLTPDADTQVGAFTEATFSGYASGTVPNNWGAAQTVNGTAESTNATDVEFTHNGGAVANTVYGYYVTTGAGATLLYSERFAMPAVMSVNNDKIILTLKVTAKTEHGNP